MNFKDFKAPPLDGLVIEDKTRGIFKVNRNVFTEGYIYELEQKRVFERAWLYACHTSEIEAPESFVAREVAGRPLLLTRDLNGRMHAFYNTCSHRGAKVCRERAGKARTFQCAYHDWTYDLEGKLAWRPGSEDSYSDASCSKASFGLTRVPKLAEFRGFVFVCFDAGADPLEDFLAGACEYLDLIASTGADGMMIVGGTHEYASRANWKLYQENGADGYHGAPTHSTYFDYLRARTLHDTGVATAFVPTKGFGEVLDLGRGHIVSVSQGAFTWGRPVARWIPEWGEEARAQLAKKRSELTSRLGEEKATRIAETDRNMMIFPNLSVHDIMAVLIRTCNPEGPDYMKVNAWALAPKEETGVLLERRLTSFLEFLGPAGFGTPDDVEMLELCQLGYRNRSGAEWNDISRGMATERKHATKTDELQIRAFWRQWYSMMCAA